MKAGRLYRVNYGIRAISVPGNGSCRHFTMASSTPGTAIPGTTLLVDNYSYCGSAPNYNMAAWTQAFVVPADATVSVVLYINGPSGGDAYPMYISVEDIGPVRGQQ